MGLMGARKSTILSSGRNTWYKVAFDGTNDYLTRGAQVTNLTDGTEFTFAARLSKPVDGVFQDIIRINNDRLFVQWNSTNSLLIRATDTGGTERLYQASTQLTGQGNTMIEFLASWRSNTTPDFHFYRDGVSDVSLVLNTAGTIDMTQTDFGIMANTGGGDKATGHVEYIYFTNSYIDLSVQANRDKFKFANMGPNGTGPTGSAPRIYLTGSAAEWNAGTANKGDGGTFTMTGSVTDV